MPHTPASQCLPGTFPDCGCHYTTDDDGIHFCPLHAAAPALLEACIALQMEAAARGCGLRIADEAIAQAKGGA